MSTILGFFSYWLYGKFWNDSHRNILALSAGTGNSGYVVLPIATALFEEHTLSLYVLGLIGISIYESSIGCYFCARSLDGFKESVKKVARLPMLNAFFLGCMLNMSGFELPDFLDDFIENIRGAYSILGMVLIGIALSEIKEYQFDFKYTGAAFASKFLFFPMVYGAFIFIDKNFLGLYNNDYYNVLWLLAVAPLATNTIVLAALYGIHPEKVATAVVLSLIFVLAYMPIMTSIFLT
jgi:predicted permease